MILESYFQFFLHIINIMLKSLEDSLFCIIHKLFIISQDKDYDFESKRRTDIVTI